MAQLNCSHLAVRKSFAAYAQDLVNETGGDFVLLNQCRRQVCTALWGAENGDVSGIGMIIAYFLDHILGLALCIAVIISSRGSRSHIASISERGRATFHDCSSFLAFSIEIASTVLLIKVDFGISTAGMGGYTVVMVTAVSMLVLLPLAYSGLGHSMSFRDSRSQETDAAGKEGGESRRFGLFALCWALAFYPFYSALNAAFGPSEISDRADAAMSTAQYRTIKDMCFRDNNATTDAEDRLMVAFVLLTYVPLSVALVGSILWSGIKSNHADSSLRRKLEALRTQIPGNVKSVLAVLSLASIPSLAVGLLWSILRSRQAQKALARVLSNEDDENEWTFGQVAAVTLFAPVAFECWNAFVSHRRMSYSEQTRNSLVSGGK